MRHYSKDFATLALAPEGGVRLLGDPRLAPLAGRLGKNLDRGCTNFLAPDWRRFDAALD
jgi:hypothetical protein